MPTVNVAAYMRTDLLRNLDKRLKYIIADTEYDLFDGRRTPYRDPDFVHELLIASAGDQYHEFIAVMNNMTEKGHTFARKYLLHEVREVRVGSEKVGDNSYATNPALKYFNYDTNLTVRPSGEHTIYGPSTVLYSDSSWFDIRHSDYWVTQLNALQYDMMLAHAPYRAMMLGVKHFFSHRSTMGNVLRDWPGAMKLLPDELIERMGTTRGRGKPRHEPKFSAQMKDQLDEWLMMGVLSGRTQEELDPILLEFNIETTFSPWDY